MPSVRELKCPVCGVENGPCIVERGIEKFHVERQRAAYPTIYKHPECTECRKLKDAAVYAEDSLRTFRPDFGDYKSKSRWPKAWRSGHDRLQDAVHLAQAEYEFHLGTEHKDDNESRDQNLLRNFEIITREERLKP